jgi:hypothetical protein
VGAHQVAAVDASEGLLVDRGAALLKAGGRDDRLRLSMRLTGGTPTERAQHWEEKNEEKLTF